MSKHEMESEALILEKVKELFFKYGIKSVTMDDIAAHLGMSKKTIYLHFSDKNALIERVLDEQLNSDKCICEQLINSDRNAIEILFELMIKGFKDLGHMNPALFFDLEKYHRPLFDKLMNYKQQYIKAQTQNLIEKGIAEGVFLSDYEPSIAAAMHIKHLDLILTGELFNPLKQPVKDSLNDLMKIFIRGIATPIGIAHFEALVVKNQKQ